MLKEIPPRNRHYFVLENSLLSEANRNRFNMTELLISKPGLLFFLSTLTLKSKGIATTNDENGTVSEVYDQFSMKTLAVQRIFFPNVHKSGR